MTLTADSQGNITGHFVIPANVPAGTKLVEFVGRGGGHGTATFVGRGQITLRELRLVRTENTIITTHIYAYDPLAQTFTLETAALISGVDIWVCAKGTSGKFMVQIRETGNGVPGKDVISEFSMNTASLVVGQMNRIMWTPVRLEAGVEYALVLACDDAVTSVGIAELGKFDAALQRWVTSQPYQIGVLLSSSNLSTWTPHQDRDLTFRLLSTPLAAIKTTIPLPDVAVTNCDELIIMAAIERPTAECDVVFNVTLPDNSVFTVGEGEVIVMPATITGTLKFSATLTGSINATPRLHKDIQVIYGLRANTGTYISRAITAGTGSKIRVYYEVYLPGSSTCLIEVAQDVLGTGGWTTVPVIAGTPVGDGWVDTTNQLTGWNSANAVVRITLSGNARMRPALRKFRVVVT